MLENSRVTVVGLRRGKAPDIFFLGFVLECEMRDVLDERCWEVELKRSSCGYLGR